MSAAEFLAQQLESRWGTVDNWAQHILDAMQAAGYAVVELPKADSPNVYDAHCATRVRAKNRGVHVEYLENGSRDQWRDLAWRLPSDARSLAAALLAAADAADASGTPVEASQQETTK